VGIGFQVPSRQSVSSGRIKSTVGEPFTGAVSTLAKQRRGGGKKKRWMRELASDMDGMTGIRRFGCCVRQPLSHGTECLAQAVCPGNPGSYYRNRLSTQTWRPAEPWVALAWWEMRKRLLIEEPGEVEACGGWANMFRFPLGARFGGHESVQLMMVDAVHAQREGVESVLPVLPAVRSSAAPWPSRS
jgi:hypothetical protein